MNKCSNCDKQLTKPTQKKFCSRQCSIQNINSKRKETIDQREQCRKCRMIGRGLTIVLIILVLIHILTGCSHSGASTTKVYGVHIQIPIPQFPLALNIGYIESSRVYMRQNTQAKISNQVSSGVDTGLKSQLKLPAATVTGKLGTTIEIKTGAQANGYVRDTVTSVTSKVQVQALKAIYDK